MSEEYVDSNWCPECGMSRDVCDCDVRKSAGYTPGEWNEMDCPDEGCTHDYLDREGFCIDCGVHVTSRLSVPRTSDEDDDEDGDA